MNLTLVSPLGVPVRGSFELRGLADLDEAIATAALDIPIRGLEGSPATLSPRSLRDLDPYPIVASHPPGLEACRRRDALRMLRGPLGGMPRFRKAIQKEWATDRARNRMRILPHTEIDEAKLRQRILDAKDADGESTLERTLRLAMCRPDSEYFESVLGALVDFLIELLQPERRAVRVERAIVDEMQRRTDERLSRWLDEDVFAAPGFRPLERAACGAAALASHAPLRWVLVESVDAIPAGLPAPDGPLGALVVDRPIDLEADAATVAAWVDAGRRAGYERVFFPLSSALSELAASQPDRLRAAVSMLPAVVWPTLRLAVGQVRLRLPYRLGEWFVREFNYVSRHLDVVAGTTALQLALAWSRGGDRAPIFYLPHARQRPHWSLTSDKCPALDAWTEPGGLDVVPPSPAPALIEAGVGWVGRRQDPSELEQPIALKP